VYKKKLGLVLKNCQINSSGIRGIVDGSLADMKRTDRLAVVTAVDEVISNIVKHVCRNSKGDLKIDIYQSRKRLKIVIEDSNRPFDPTQIQSQSYDEIIDKEIEGHLGLRIIHKVMDRIKYRRLKDKNRLVLEKMI